MIRIGRPKRKCSKPSCNAFVDYTETYCMKHKASVSKQYNNEIRFNKDNKHIASFYASGSWKKTRNSFIAAYPLCKRCYDSGKVTAARIVHHKIEVRDDFSKRLEWDNLESICQNCHNQEHKKKYLSPPSNTPRTF